MIIKVCGLRDPENVRCIDGLDVDWLGFIFYPPSPRYVPYDSKLIETIGSCKKNKVGVFVNEELAVMLEKSILFHIDMIQLHGNEKPEVCLTLRQMGFPVIKAFSIESERDFQQTALYLNFCDYFLFDTKAIGYGGSGKRFDWNLLAAYPYEKPFLLSGGITPDSSVRIEQLTHPQLAGIDLNSGFELSPAMKDVSKIKEFLSQRTQRNTENHRRGKL